MNKTGASFTVRFLHNSDQIFIDRTIVDKDGNGAALFQVVDTTSGVPSPDWTIPNNQPIIRVKVRSSAGYPAEIANVTWNFDGRDLVIVYNGTSWVTATGEGGTFQGRVNEDGAYELKVVKNIASKDVVSNKQISYSITYRCNGRSDTVQGSVDVLIQQAGSSSHILQIATNRVELDQANPTCTLTAKAMYGPNPVTIGTNGYRIEWWQGDTKLTGQEAATLTVTREMVQGGAIFIAKLYKGTDLVAQDGQRISDIADEYQIVYKPQDAGKNHVGLGHNAVYNLTMIRNGKVYAGNVTYAWDIYNALGVKTASGTAASVTVKPDNCVCGTGVNAYYSDADVAVTAEF